MDFGPQFLTLSATCHACTLYQFYPRYIDVSYLSYETISSCIGTTIRNLSDIQSLGAALALKQGDSLDFKRPICNPPPPPPLKEL